MRRTWPRRTMAFVSDIFLNVVRARNYQIRRWQENIHHSRVPTQTKHMHERVPAQGPSSMPSGPMVSTLPVRVCQITRSSTQCPPRNPWMHVYSVLYCTTSCVRPFHEGGRCRQPRWPRQRRRDGDGGGEGRWWGQKRERERRGRGRKEATAAGGGRGSAGRGGGGCTAAAAAGTRRQAAVVAHWAAGGGGRPPPPPPLRSSAG